jgi:hypothetical protein
MMRLPPTRRSQLSTTTMTTKWSLPWAVVVAVAAACWWTGHEVGVGVDASAAASTSPRHPHCLADPALRAEFEIRNDAYEIPRPDSCCMQDVCGLKCPIDVDEPHPGYGFAAFAFVLASLILGVLCAWFFLESNALQFFVAGRALPLFVTTMTLAAQAIDTSSLLGNVDLSYRSGFWDGYVGKLQTPGRKRPPNSSHIQLLLSRSTTSTSSSTPSEPSSPLV